MDATEFMNHAVKPMDGNTAWASRYAETIRQVLVERAGQAPRTLQRHLGPSELGVECDRQVVGKMAGHPHTNHVSDPWPSIVGTAVHAWLADNFLIDNQAKGVLRWITETRVTPHPDHPGTGDLYDAVEQSVGDWKGLALDTLVPTPGGWSTTGELALGDHVLGSNGRPCTVTKVYPVQHRDCYRVTLDDGTEVVCDDLQEWVFNYGTQKRSIRQMSTADAVRQVFSTDSRPQRQLRLPNPSPIELPNAPLIVHPYVLGCWLGDGSIHSGMITKPDDNLFEHIESCGYGVGQPIGRREISRTVYKLSTELQALGLQWKDAAWPDSHGRLYGVKRVPIEYLRGSYDQRLALLQGLMDTDGTWNKGRKQAVFTTTDLVLAEAVRELAVSLGSRCTIQPHMAHGFGKSVLAYHVPFTPVGFIPFRLERKASLVPRQRVPEKSTRRMVRSIEPVPSVPTRCIDVDSDDHQFLATENMIPAHNCLGDTTMSKLKRHGPPRKYLVQMLLYALGFRNLGLPVKRIALLALPRTGSSLEGVYVWEHELTAEDDALLVRVFEQTRERTAMAELLAQGLVRFDQIPATPDESECIFCPYFRPEAAYGAVPGCPGPRKDKSAEVVPVAQP